MNNESINHTVGTESGAPKNTEQAVAADVLAMVESANAFAVTNDEEYARAGAVLQDIKRRKDSVETFFAPLVEAAHKAHKALTDRRKALLDPLTAADAAVRRVALAYKQEQDRKKAEAEAEQRLLQRREAERLAAEAAALEEAGKVFEAEQTFAMAEIVNDIKPAAVVPAAPKLSGISTQKVWVAEIVDDAQVPVSILGMMLRPIDMALLNTWAKNTKGTAQIPGVRFVEKEIMKVRN